jgi:hypothetical protein
MQPLPPSQSHMMMQ